MAVKAVGKQVGISAKKLRPILNALRGKPVTEALEQLRFSPGPNAESVAAVLRSAAANAEKNNALDPTRLGAGGAFPAQAGRPRVPAAESGAERKPAIRAPA